MSLRRFLMWLERKAGQALGHNFGAATIVCIGGRVYVPVGEYRKLAENYTRLAQRCGCSKDHAGV